MAKFLVHVHTGPSDPTKATLACLVAATALKEGHEVSIFMAGDGVHLLAPETVSALEGQGTGALRDHLAAIREGGGTLYLSGMSAKARGYDESLLEGHPATFAMPDELVRLAAEADTVLCY
ncbi:DsrE/DsrF-like family protein [Pseudoruegeria aquimaris]|uniref:DsrE/DsrF-like family protein n=1 Tax=Pseudoruegeria aquimaris TaxID=393663 RepID=A0A1Y5SG03_9RHOB|nr:DsrE family protein [Pseudoruegeria aquimaris]SLN39569.1 DsrE/DsrF-like family protein [Pseudoruegeria aquimaris]